VNARGNERQELATRLRELREAAELSTTRLAASLGWSQSKVSKIENGRTRPAISDVEAWLAAVDAPSDLRAVVVDLAESVHVASTIWDQTLRGGREEHQRVVGRLREQAVEIRVFQNGVVPGLLQTAEYARRVLRLADVFQLRDTTQAAATRIERQTILYEDGRTFEFVVTEAALRYCPGPPGLLVAQYDKLLSALTLPGVSISVLPSDSTASTVQIQPFVIYRLPDDTALVTIETYTRELTLTDAEEVKVYQEVYERLRADALRGHRAIEWLNALRAQALATSAPNVASDEGQTVKSQATT
jgi:transcriptional regulator with XRE-family HTH domain